ncbi:hypothetical protein QFC20_004862 [Naganishia adeliensis]|uniref:Uncharacterized protein n=1 Tax=Naganishia adeliensis TaxID=92952 RepID=A0ACC2VWA8_9TREE|nr:hypothetical protein QFC20_004862 [Naganishia adeliensis]
MDGWTPTQDLPVVDYAAPVQEGHNPSAEENDINDTSPYQDLDQDDPTLWDESIVAPVNTDDLVNLAMHSPVGMVLATPELRIYWVNKRWYEITQVERGQDLNSWIDNIDPDSMPMVIDILQGLMNSKVKRTGDIKWKNGGWFTFTAQVSTDSQGNVTGVAATIDDCTQRKTLELAQLESMKKEQAAARSRAEEASARARELVDLQSQREVLERRTKEFAQMAEISSIALTCAMPDGELIWANKAFCELHDLQLHEINSWATTVIDEDRKLLEEKWFHTLRTHEPLYSRHRLKNGRVLQAQTVPSIRGEDKENCTFVSAIMDITTEVRHQQAVERLNEERIKEQTRLAAEAEDRRKAAVFQKEQQALLIDVTSHELRNSLNPITQSAILIKASLLAAQGRTENSVTGESKDGIDIEEDLEACDAIIDSANQMERVANDVLGLAQIQANQLAVTPVPFDLTMTMRSIHRMFKADCRAKGVQMTVEMGKGVQALGSRRLLKGRTDPSRLSQTTVNLMSNAMKFIVKSEKRHVRIRIDISLDKPEDSGPIAPPSEPSMLLDDNTPIYLYIAVHDTGPGLTEKELGKLFQRFSQANSDD